MPSKYTQGDGFVPNTLSLRELREMEMGIYRPSKWVVKKPGRNRNCSDADVKLAGEIFDATGQYKEVAARMLAERGIDKTPDAWRKLVNRQK